MTEKGDHSPLGTREPELRTDKHSEISKKATWGNQSAWDCDRGGRQKVQSGKKERRVIWYPAQRARKKRMRGVTVTMSSGTPRTDLGGQRGAASISARQRRDQRTHIKTIPEKRLQKDGRAKGREIARTVYDEVESTWNGRRTNWEKSKKAAQ